MHIGQNITLKIKNIDGNASKNISSAVEIGSKKQLCFVLFWQTWHW